MDKVVKVFTEELASASNDLIKLSVMTALHSFLSKTKSTRCTQTFLNSNGLMAHLVSVLNSEDITDGNECHSKSKSVTEVRKLLRQMTLQCLFELSKSKHTFDLQESVISCLLRFCDFKNGGFHLFKYSPNFTKCVIKYIKSKKGMIKTKLIFNDVAEKMLSDIASLKRHLEFYQPDLAPYVELIFGKQLHLLCLSDVTPLERVNSSERGLVDILVSQQVAWGRVPNHCKESDKRGEETMKTKEKKKSPVHGTTALKEIENANELQSECAVCDVHVTRIIHGNLMWVNKGFESVGKVEEIHSHLEQHMSSLQVCCECRTGDIIAMFIGDGEGGQHLSTEAQIVRGKVLQASSKVMSQTRVTAFALDIGGVYTVSQASVFHLPPDIGLARIPPQAQLASLYGPNQELLKSFCSSLQD